MQSLQEDEVVQLRELTAFLNLEINFAEQYLQTLKDTRAEWTTELATFVVVPKVISLSIQVAHYPEQTRKRGRPNPHLLAIAQGASEIQLRAIKAINVQSIRSWTLHRTRV